MHRNNLTASTADIATKSICHDSPAGERRRNLCGYKSVRSNVVGDGASALLIVMVVACLSQLSKQTGRAWTNSQVRLRRPTRPFALPHCAGLPVATGRGTP